MATRPEDPPAAPAAQPSGRSGGLGVLGLVVALAAFGLAALPPLMIAPPEPKVADAAEVVPPAAASAADDGGASSEQSSAAADGDEKARSRPSLIAKVAAAIDKGIERQRRVDPEEMAAYRARLETMRLVSLVLGGLGVLLGAASLARRESLRLGLLALGFSGAAIVWTWVVVAIVIGVVIAVLVVFLKGAA